MADQSQKPLILELLRIVIVQKLMGNRIKIMVHITDKDIAICSMLPEVCLQMLPQELQGVVRSPSLLAGAVRVNKCRLYHGRQYLVHKAFLHHPVVVLDGLDVPFLAPLVDRKAVIRRKPVLSGNEQLLQCEGALQAPDVIDRHAVLPPLSFAARSSSSLS